MLSCSPLMTPSMAKGAATPFTLHGELDKYSGLGLGAANYGKAFKERKRLTLLAMKEFIFGGSTLEDTVLEEVGFFINEMKMACKRDGLGRPMPTDIHLNLIHLAVSNVICSVVFGHRFEYTDESFRSAVASIRYAFSGQTGSMLASIPFAWRLPSVKRLLAREDMEGRNVLNFIIVNLLSR